MDADFLTTLTTTLAQYQTDVVAIGTAAFLITLAIGGFIWAKRAAK